MKENHKNLFIPEENIEIHENCKIPRQSHEKNENLCIPFKNIENHEIHRIPRQKNKNY